MRSITCRSGRVAHCPHRRYEVPLYTPHRGRVPPRRRRDGYRPATLGDDLCAVIAAGGERLEGIGNALEIIAAVGDTYAALDDALEAIAVPRLRAVAQLRAQGWSYDRIAAATDLSKGRVAQLVRAARDRDLL